MCYHYGQGVVLKRGFPYNSFLFDPNDVFMDFFNPRFLTNDIASPYDKSSPSLNHFPFLYILTPIIHFYNPLISFLIFVGSSIIISLHIFYSNLKVESITITFTYVLIYSFLSYPYLFSIDRGNYEIFIFIIIYFFITNFLKKKYLNSYFFLGFSILLKPTPAVFFIILLHYKKYKEAAFILISVVIITGLSYASLQGGLSINLRQHLTNLGLYNDLYAIGDAGLMYGNSLWGMGKSLVKSFYGDHINSVDLNLYLKIYTLLTFISFFFLSIYIILIENKVWKIVFLLIAAMNIFPHVSGDYKLMYIFIPLFLFINDEERRGTDLVYATLFSLLLIPKDYFHFDFNPLVSSSVILNPLITITMIFIIFREGFSEFQWKNRF